MKLRFGSVGMELPLSKDLSIEAANVGAVTRQILVKTLRAGKDLACALVFCKAWRSMTVL
jgi:hypothetical protein